MKIKKFKKISYILLLILIVAFLLRTYRMLDVFTSNDEMDPVFHAMKTLSIEWNKENLLSLGSKNPVARLFVYPVSLGGINTVLIWGLAGNKILHIPITEFFWFFPFILMGVLSILFVYLFIKKIQSKECALFVAAILCVLPIHIALSRVISQLIVAFFLNILFVFLYICYFETKKKKYLLGSSIVLSLYILSHNSFLGIAPFLLYLPLAYAERIKNKIRHVLRVVLDWRFFALPCLTLVFLVAIHFAVVKTTGIACYDLIGHTFSGSKTSLGFYLFDSLPAILANIGVVLSILVLSSLYFGIKEIIQMKKRAAIFILGISYTLPFLVLVPGSATGVWGHIAHGLMWLVVYVGLMIPTIYDSIVSSKSTTKTRHFYDIIKIIVLVIILLATLSGSFIYVYRQTILLKDYAGLQSAIGDGVYKPDNGVKAAGYWIRKHTPPTAVVFSDATGGGGIEPPVGSYYFNRKIMGIKDGTIKEVYALLLEKIDNVDVIVMEPKNENELNKVFMKSNQTFFKIGSIRDGSKELLRLYSRNKFMHVEYDIKEVNKLYDQEYHHLDDYMNGVFIKEELSQLSYFRDKCSKTKLHRFYLDIGIIRK